MSDFVVLAVCLGNICRSPLAERMLRRRFRDQLGSGAAVKVSSAGVLAPAGAQMDEASTRELRRLGGDPDGHVSKQLNPPMVQGADLILTATSQLRWRVLEEFPGALRRTFTIREFAGIVSSEEFRGQPASSARDLVQRSAWCRSSLRLQEYDVLDPIGQSQAFHRAVADVLDAECSIIARSIAAAVTSESGSTRLRRSSAQVAASPP